MGVEGRSEAGAQASAPSPRSNTFILRRRLAPALCLPVPQPGPFPLSAARASVRAPARVRRSCPALAPTPPSCGSAGAPLGAARAWHLSLAAEGRRALSGRVWVGADLRAYTLVCGGKRDSGAGASASISRAGCWRLWEARQWRGSPWTRFRERTAPRPPLLQPASEEGLGGACPRPLRRVSLPTFLPSFISRLSGTLSAREAEKPVKSSGYDLPGCIGRDPSACGQESSASVRELIVVD